MFDARGLPRDPLGAHEVLHDGRGEPAAGGAFDTYVNNILAGIEEHRAQAPDHRLQLIFFFHGGLNSRNAALDRAQKQIAAMSGNRSLYPIFVNWQTSLYASYKDHLLFVTKGQDTYRGGALLAPFKFGGDVGRFVFDLVPDNALAIRDLARHWTYVREGAVLPAGSASSTCSLDDLDFREGTTRARSRANRFADKAGAFASYLITKWWATGIIDAAGTPAWSSMNYTADRLFYSDREMHHDYDYGTPALSGAGDFARFLRALIASGKVHKDDEVILAAHSAGAIVANTMIQQFGEQLPIRKLVYMAPACTIDELMPGGRVANFLAADRDRELYILTLHEVAELSERHFVDLTPRGSLLIWLDQYIQPKNSEFRGHMMGRARNLRLHAHLIPCQIRKQIHITAYSEQPQFAPGEKAMFEPQTHGSFGELHYWEGRSVWRPDSEDLRPICISTDPRALRDPKPNGSIAAGAPPRCMANLP